MNNYELLNAEERFRYQARWTRMIREYISGKLPKNRLWKILEVGCGTGAVLECFVKEFPEKIGMIMGLDHNENLARYAKQKKIASICIGEGENLPYMNDRFDLVYCHYLLLWVKDKNRIIHEMKRVTVPGGILAVMAEPCYTEMHASPKDLALLAGRQRRKLAERGADLSSGKKLCEIITNAGLQKFECGKYQDISANDSYLAEEIRQMLEDAGEDDFGMDPEQKYHYSVPTYYAIAQKI